MGLDHGRIGSWDSSAAVVQRSWSPVPLAAAVGAVAVGAAAVVDAAAVVVVVAVVAAAGVEAGLAVAAARVVIAVYRRWSGLEAD